MSLPTGTKLGPYEIIELLGAGGMGEVYRARDERLDRSVAVKTIRASSREDADAARRLASEARAAASISHPNVACIFDIGEQAGIAYIVMELVEGLSLEAKLAAGPLPPADIVDIGRGLAAALAAAHQRGVIHRDIKPANILITTSGQVKVLDFGLAKVAAGAAVSSTGVVIGTVAYMSPEQALGEPITSATDVFSAGVVLYRMATAALPFTGATLFQSIERILHAEVPGISRPDLPREFAGIVRRSLEKKPESRYRDGAALAEALAAMAQAEPSGRADRPAIAVLPFDDLSPARDNEYFSHGLADEITVALSRIRSLIVVPRAVTARYTTGDRSAQSLAADVGVRYLLEGSVRKIGEALRISAQLIDAVDGSTVWAETYNGTLQNVFEIQEEVARKIVDAMVVTLTPAERIQLGKRPTLDAAAFDLYLRGRHHLEVGTRRDLDAAISLFAQALTRDSRYAAAHAGQAEAATTYYEYYDRSETWMDRSMDSALKALMYDALLPEAYAALGLAYFNRDQLEESRSACQRAIELDPENWIGYWTLGRIYYLRGLTEESIQLLQRVITLNPEFYPAYFTLRMVCQASGREEIYQPYLSRLLEEIFPTYLRRNPADARARNSYGTELATAGRVSEGRQEVDAAFAQAPDDPLVLYATGCYEAMFGERERALKLLERAIDCGFANIRYLAQDPDLRRLHDHPSFAGLVRRSRGPEVTGNLPRPGGEGLADQ